MIDSQVDCFTVNTICDCSYENHAVVNNITRLQAGTSDIMHWSHSDSCSPATNRRLVLSTNENHCQKTSGTALWRPKIVESEFHCGLHKHRIEPAYSPLFTLLSLLPDSWSIALFYNSNFDSLQILIHELFLIARILLSCQSFQEFTMLEWQQLTQIQLILAALQPNQNLLHCSPSWSHIDVMFMWDWWKFLIGWDQRKLVCSKSLKDCPVEFTSYCACSYHGHCQMRTCIMGLDKRLTDIWPYKCTCVWGIGKLVQCMSNNYNTLLISVPCVFFSVIM